MGVLAGRDVGGSDESWWSKMGGDHFLEVGVAVEKGECLPIFSQSGGAKYRRRERLRANPKRYPHS